MGRRTVVICTDDLTGQEHPETEVEDVALRFGYDEWTLTLTAESKAKIGEQFASLVENAPHKDHTPKWLRDQQAAANSQPSTETTDPPKVTIVPPDNATVRRWWRDLTAAQLKTLDLKEPTKSNNGKIPEPVVAAFVAAHAAPAAQFSG